MLECVGANRTYSTRRRVGASASGEQASEGSTVETAGKRDVHSDALVDNRGRNCRLIPHSNILIGPDTPQYPGHYSLDDIDAYFLRVVGVYSLYFVVRVNSLHVDIRINSSAVRVNVLRVIGVNSSRPVEALNIVDTFECSFLYHSAKQRSYSDGYAYK